MEYNWYRKPKKRRLYIGAFLPPQLLLTIKQETDGSIHVDSHTAGRFSRISLDKLEGEFDREPDAV